MDDFLRFLRSLPIRGKCRCGTKIDHPGICAKCDAKRNIRESDAMFASALESIPGFARASKFESPELVKYCGSDAARAGRAAIDDILSKQTRGAVLIGEKGAGKTSLACAMLREAIDRKHPLALRGRFVSCVELAECRKDHPLGSKPWILEEACKATLLVLDEFGRGGDRGPLVEVLSARYDDERPTIVTTPWTQEELAKMQFDGGMLRRVFERSAVLRMG